MGANQVRPAESTCTGPTESEGNPSAVENVLNSGSRQRSMPLVVPTQRLPSLSSNREVTSPRSRESRGSRVTAPSRVTRISPRAPAATQMLSPRSRIICSTRVRASGSGTPARVTSLPFQRATPLSVPIHRLSPCPASRQLTFGSGSPLVVVVTRDPCTRTRPAPRVPSHTSPPRVSAIDTTTAVGIVLERAIVEVRLAP